MRSNTNTTVFVSLLLLSLGVTAQTQAQPWQVQTLPTRVIESGKTAMLALASRSAVAVPTRHVLLVLSPYSLPMLTVDRGNTALILSLPWVTASTQLNQRGVAVAFADAPSDANKRSLSKRPASDIADDLNAAVVHLKQKFPGLPIHLAGFGVGAGPLMETVADVTGLSHVLIASGAFNDHRTTDWSKLKQPVLLIHAPSAQCDSAPFIEAEWVAQKNHFTLVQAGYPQAEAKPNCGASSQHVLSKLETELADTVAQWLDGAPPPATIGYPSPGIAWREQLIHYTAPATFGSNQLEMTLLYPPGPGPHPVVVYNHGDIEIDSAYMRYKRRFVDRVVAREFLQLGWAVALPSRPGVGLSQGHYRRSFAAADADATYKARVHAQDILPVFDYLRSNPDLNAHRIVVAGQSAGGYAALLLASMNLPGVVGAVDFSGGRTDVIRNDAPGYLNTMMVDGFAELGKSTKVPTLWVFAENDSRYTANTIRTSHQAFIQAGGKASLSLSPPIEGDGHFVHHKPELWRAALRDYLTALEGVALAR